MRGDFKVYQDVFDKSTLMAISALSKKHDLELKMPIKTGKESDVYLMEGDELIAAKIYRIYTSSFKNMWKYIHGDSRFPFLGNNQRKLVFAWTEKEYKNLMFVGNLGIPCPKPLDYKKNVLLMEYIGDGDPAPTAKKLPPKEPKKWLKEIMKYVKKMEKKGFVHGDLSEYNVLNFNEKPIIIDWSQSIFEDHPLFEKLVERDIKNVKRWLKNV